MCRVFWVLIAGVDSHTYDKVLPLSVKCGKGCKHRQQNRDEGKEMFGMFLSEEGAPHPLVMAIIAIALAVLCFGGCSTTDGGEGCCDGCVVKPAGGVAGR